MNKTLILLTALTAATACTPTAPSIDYGSTFEIDEATLRDKIRGGWAGQTIGCTYGGPTEFKYKGALISDEAPIVWYDDYAYDTFRDDPGLYDDVYMDLTFVEVMQRYGIDAPAEVYARAFANADYKLWHANQAARYNILHGIMPPASGHWHNNPHADDIDFQIEADFIGMICPGMPNAASEIGDHIGHIMNYGDGFYGGIYIGALYSLAFVCDDIPTIVREALRTIPPQSKYRRCIEDVIRFHEEFPDDWRRCWLEIERRYAYEKGCPEGVFNGFNIDATINSAYVVMGLLYGNGDFERTMDVATRCGQDSDCNPASAAGILGVMKGYDAIPDKWKPAMEKVVDIDFPYTSISLNKIYDINLDLLTQMIGREGGSVEDGVYRIVLQRPEELPYEESFATVEPTERRVLKLDITDEATLRFTGNSVVVMGQVRRLGLGGDDGYLARIEASIDGKLVENIEMPYDYIKRKYDIFYTYELPVDGPHTLNLKWTNPDPNYVIEAKEMVVYSAKK
jgi:hypothetical protein|uniref:ADP-ribosylglycohydrolase family protein n=1 Tax=Alistipes sp. Marseille-P5061 TaxID=2048242 RepID=UPI000D0F2E76|nr:ADP-ribosylglycohydrolase family protein [Alistipes sp. Marseille-P5061]